MMIPLKEIEEYYDGRLEMDFCANVRDNNPRHEYVKKSLETVKSLFEGKRVLSVGCGVGVLEDYMANFCLVTGIDISGKKIEYAREHFGAEYIHSSFEEFTTESPYDAICFIDALEHIQDQEMIIKKINELLLDGGVLLMNIPRKSIIEKWHKEESEILQIVDRLVDVDELVESMGIHYHTVYRHEYYLYTMILMIKAKIPEYGELTDKEKGHMEGIE